MKKVKDGILAEGEATGHAHRVSVDVFETDERTRVFEGATSVTHEEHKVIELPAKEWESDRVSEFDHFEQAARKVQD